jgi:hypothetical protein
LSYQEYLTPKVQIIKISNIKDLKNSKKGERFEHTIAIRLGPLEPIEPNKNKLRSVKVMPLSKP